MSRKRLISQVRPISAVVVAILVVVALPQFVQAGVAHQFGGFGNFGFGSSFINVGGVAIDAKGMLADVDREVRDKVRQQRDKLKLDIPEGLKDGTELRKFSLRDLQKEMMRIRREDRPGRLFSDSLMYMAGIQRIKYVFVYPEDNDIVLAGPAEAWRFNEAGEVVGVTTGRPVVLLEDFLVALRTALNPASPVISCSIDPTPQGVEEMRKYTGSLKSIRNPLLVQAEIEKRMGPQTVTIGGVETRSRFAWILAGADYRMKNLAMGIEKSPVQGLSSYMSMMGTRRPKNMMPRWWIEDNYEALLTDDKGLAWELRGPGIRVMTEEEFVADDGSRKAAGKADPIAKKWADTMTAKYDELAAKQPIFGHLRNCIDLAMISALIVGEKLHTKAGLDLEIIADAELMPIRNMNAPKFVPTQATVTKKGRNWVITASGGVKIDAFRAIRKQEKTDKLAQPRDDAIAPAGAEWWWN